MPVWINVALFQVPLQILTVHKFNILGDGLYGHLFFKNQCGFIQMMGFTSIMTGRNDAYVLWNRILDLSLRMYKLKVCKQKTFCVYKFILSIQTHIHCIYFICVCILHIYTHTLKVSFIYIKINSLLYRGYESIIVVTSCLGLSSQWDVNMNTIYFSQNMVFTQVLIFLSYSLINLKLVLQFFSSWKSSSVSNSTSDSI